MKKHAGFTLIELMVAGFIGAFILTGLLNLFITTNKSVTLSDSLSQNQETGRFAMYYLTKYLRKAGYNDDVLATFTAPLYIPPSTATNPVDCTAIANSASTTFSPCTKNNPDPATVLGDVLSIPINVGASPGNEITSCTGTIFGGDGSWANKGLQKIANVFWVSPERELRCQTFNRVTNSWVEPAPVSIINNVERLEIQIGMATASTSINTSSYVSADVVETSASNMERVRSVRVAILTTSQDDLDINKVQSTTRNRTYNLLDAPDFDINDSNLRNIFINTIEFPNMIETAGN